ncbi:hypothetical protein E2C01_008645 [Portunus trituberculatus]|uniref:Uncharacterized protein n=1 Tax=Portunus trituberculatus TaxID=210409 RepID=A0A5B7D1B8_PORTR|nr:hypothetical protein [Portunus trituberculatus]
MWAAGAATHAPPAWLRHVILRGLDLSGGVSYTDDIARGLIINPKLRCEASAEPSTIADRIRVNRVTFVRGIKGTSSHRLAATQTTAHIFQCEFILRQSRLAYERVN